MSPRQSEGDKGIGSNFKVMMGLTDGGTLFYGEGAVATDEPLWYVEGAVWTDSCAKPRKNGKKR